MPTSGLRRLYRRDRQLNDTRSAGARTQADHQGRVEISARQRWYLLTRGGVMRACHTCYTHVAHAQHLTMHCLSRTPRKQLCHSPQRSQEWCAPLASEATAASALPPAAPDARFPGAWTRATARTSGPTAVAGVRCRGVWSLAPASGGRVRGRCCSCCCCCQLLHRLSVRAALRLLTSVSICRFGGRMRSRRQEYLTAQRRRPAQRVV